MTIEGQTLRGHFVILRPVAESDAQFIVNLRTNPTLSQHISSTENSIEKQRQWIQRYFVRNREGKEFYFITCDLTGTPWGTARLYNLTGRECTGGSWIVKKGAPFEVPLESFLLPMEFAFTTLNLQVLHIDIRKGNKRVIHWHESCRAIFTHKDNKNRYYDYTPAIFHFVKRRVYSLLQLQT